MNRTEIILKLSEESGVNIDDCGKVINSLERILDEELSSSQGILKAIDKVYGLVSRFRK